MSPPTAWDNIFHTLYFSASFSSMMHISLVCTAGAGGLSRSSCSRFFCSASTGKRYMFLLMLTASLSVDVRSFKVFTSIPSLSSALLDASQNAFSSMLSRFSCELDSFVISMLSSFFSELCFFRFSTHLLSLAYADSLLWGIPYFSERIVYVVFVLTYSFSASL